MEFRVLGPVELLDGDRLFEIVPPQRRHLVAALAVDAGRPLTAETLIDRVWDEAPPGARRTLHTHVTRIRRLLEQAGDGAQAPRLIRRSGGYLLDVDPQRVDLHRFRQLVTRARGHATDEPERIALLRAALDLWRGEPLAGLAGQWAERSRRGWEQEWSDAAVAWARAELRHGQPEAVLGPLTELIGEQPLNEAVVAELMRALHAAGRQADALALYGSTRQQLTEQLGVDPSNDLQELHRTILRGAPSVPPAVLHPTAAAPQERAAPQHRAAPHERAAPAQLPADVYAFVGRRAEFDQLDSIAASTASSATPVGARIAVLSGTAGVGKTALAVHWARLALDQFPDGHLWVDLGGYRTGEPLEPADALAGVLRGLGFGSIDLPVDVPELSARYRSAVAGRRLLILLDDAVSAEQVRPLLPGSASCLVLVTSRDRLSALIARDGARRVNVELLPAADAMALLRELVGPRVDAEPEAAAALAQRCARLPLALRVAAELAAASHGSALRTLADQLRDEHRSLDLLDADGDERTSVRAVLTWSYRALPSPAARVFRMLGLHPGRDYESYAVAALAGLPVDEAKDAISALTRAHLVERKDAGRYTMHDLLSAYAAECAAAEPAAESEGALNRLRDYYVHTTAIAVDVLYPAERHLRPDPPLEPEASAWSVPRLDDAEVAGRWLEAERGSLVALCVGPPGRSNHAVRLSAILGRHFADNGYPHDAFVIHRSAFEVTMAVGDGSGSGAALMELGAVYLRLADNVSASEHFNRALEAFHGVGDRRGQARALNNLAVIYSRWGRYEEAIDRFQRVHRIVQEIGDPIGEARALNNLGTVQAELGRYAHATENFEHALKIAAASQDYVGEALAHGNLGDIRFHSGHYRDAVSCYERTRELFGQHGHQGGAALATTDLAKVYRRQGRHTEADALQRAALDVFREIHDEDGETLALTGLSESHLALGDHRLAHDRITEALQISRRTGNRRGQVLALSALGAIKAQVGDPQAAVGHYEEAHAVVNAAGLSGLTPRVHNGLGRVLHLVGRNDEALAYHQRVLDNGVAADDRYERSRAHAGIGDIRHAAGALEDAQQHWRCALDGYAELGVPEVAELYRRLAAT